MTSYWHILFIVSKIFWRLQRNSLLLVSPSMPKLVFPTASDGKGLAAGQEELRTAQKKGRVLGEFGSFWVWQVCSIRHDRACGFDMPTCTEGCLRGLQRRTLEGRSCNYKPC